MPALVLTPRLPGGSDARMSVRLGLCWLREPISTPDRKPPPCLRAPASALALGRINGTASRERKKPCRTPGSSRGRMRGFCPAPASCCGQAPVCRLVANSAAVQWENQLGVCFQTPDKLGTQVVQRARLKPGTELAAGTLGWHAGPCDRRVGVGPQPESVLPEPGQGAPGEAEADVPA